MDLLRSMNRVNCAKGMCIKMTLFPILEPRNISKLEELGFVKDKVGAKFRKKAGDKSIVINQCHENVLLLHRIIKNTILVIRLHMNEKTIKLVFLYIENLIGLCESTEKNLIFNSILILPDDLILIGSLTESHLITVSYSMNYGLFEEKDQSVILNELIEKHYGG